MNWIMRLIYRLRFIFWRLYRTALDMLCWPGYTIVTFARATMAMLRGWRGSWINVLCWPGIAFVTSARTTVAMLRAWWAFAPMRDLVLGLPAILVLFGTITLAAVTHLKLGSELSDRYRNVALNASVAGEWDRALVALERVRELDPRGERARYELAIACEKTGNLPRCEALMQELAPRDRLGYAPAHLWIAMKLLKSDRLTQKAFDIARAHLTRARRDISQVATVDRALVDLYIAMGRTKEAREVLRRLPSASGEQLLSLSRDSADKGNSDDSKREAAAAMDRFGARVLEDPGDIDARVQMAEAGVLAGQMERAEDFLRDGVAMDPQGPCALALARFYLAWARESAKSFDAANRAKVVPLLKKARTVAEMLPPDSVPGLSLLAEISLAQNESAKAADYLRRAAPMDLASGARLAELLTLGGQKDEARVQAQTVLGEATRQLHGNAANTIARLSAAQSAAILGDYPRATSLLEEGLKENNDPRLSTLLERMYVAWYDDGRKIAPQSPPYFDLLRKTFDLNPQNAAVLQRILAVMKDNSTAADEARKFVNDRLAAGGVSAIAHLLVGTDAIQSADTEIGRKHIALAFQLGPKMVTIANNLARTLSQTEPRDLPRALDLIDQTLNQAPNNVDCLDTRGHIFMATERWEDAVSDLERVHRSRPRDAQLHRTLSEVYRRPKMVDLAKRNDDEANALEAVEPDADCRQGYQGNLQTNYLHATSVWGTFIAVVGY
jgi:tetratricopeptide (TPR) repeat protein